MLERIHVQGTRVSVLTLARICRDFEIPLQLYPRKDGTVSGSVNPGTTKRWEAFKGILKEWGIAFYHHPPSNSIYKSIVIEDVIV